MSMRRPHCGRGGSRHVGRIRIAAAKILNAAIPSVHFEPSDISPATGRHRTDWRQDTVRWEVFAVVKDSASRLPWVGQSWQRLTEFVRNAKAGGTVIVDGDGDIYCRLSNNQGTKP